jgi:hypothetical protein
MSSSSSDYKSPALCLLLGVGTYYSLQAFVPEPMKIRARQMVRRFIPWSKVLRAPQDLTRGDGLQSIFTNSSVLLEDCEVKISKDPPLFHEHRTSEESGDLTEVQKIAFDSLICCGVIDSSIGLGVLKATLKNAKLLSKAPGEYIFKHDDEHREDILVLKSGACEVLYHNLEDGTSVVVSVITERRVLASVVDIVSWIIGHSNFQCQMSVRCTEACEVISIPSPHCTTGALQSPLYVCSYANLVRSLLIRFSRTTITSSLFYLGLAEHM